MTTRGKTELREWIDQQYKVDAKLRERVKELMAEMEIEQGLVALREKRGVSQNTLAKVLGISQPAIAKLESGTAKNWKLETLLRYVSALGGRLKIEIQQKGGAKVIDLPRKAVKA